MKKTIILTAFLAAASMSYGIGLTFQTLAPTAGEFVLQDTSSALPNGALVNFGVISVDTSGFTTIGQFEAAMSVFDFANFNVNGDVAKTTASDAFNPDDVVYGIAYNASSAGSATQAAAFLIGRAPALGSIISSPVATNGVLLSTDPSPVPVAYGIFGSGGNGGNIVLAAVPEPSTYAALAGLCALGAVALRRRRRA